MTSSLLDPRKKFSHPHLFLMFHLLWSISERPSSFENSFHESTSGILPIYFQHRRSQEWYWLKIEYGSCWKNYKRKRLQAIPHLHWYFTKQNSSTVLHNVYEFSCVLYSKFQLGASSYGRSWLILVLPLALKIHSGKQWWYFPLFEFVPSE